MPKLNKTQTYAIKWLNSQNKSSLEIADELKLTEKQVINIVEKSTQSLPAKDSQIKTKTSLPNNTRSQNLMIRHTAGKKSNNVSIMTGEASALNDELKKNQTGFNPNTEKAIFRPRQK